MKAIVISTLALLFAISALSGEAKLIGNSYDFTLPDDVTFESKKNMEFYSFRWGTPPNIALFMLNKYPVPITPKALKPMSDMMEITLEDQLKEKLKATDVQKKRTELDLGPFKGTQIEFTLKTPNGLTLRQYMFILHDGEDTWSGQLTAHGKDDIAKAHMILKNAKKRISEPNGNE